MSQKPNFDTTNAIIVIKSNMKILAYFQLLHPPTHQNDQFVICFSESDFTLSRSLSVAYILRTIFRFQTLFFHLSTVFYFLYFLFFSRFTKFQYEILKKKSQFTTYLHKQQTSLNSFFQNFFKKFRNLMNTVFFPLSLDVLGRKLF